MPWTPLSSTICTHSYPLSLVTNTLPFKEKVFLATVALELAHGGNSWVCGSVVQTCSTFNYSEIISLWYGVVKINVIWFVSPALPTTVTKSCTDDVFPVGDKSRGTVLLPAVLVLRMRSNVSLNTLGVFALPFCLAVAQDTSLPPKVTRLCFFFNGLDYLPLSKNWCSRWRKRFQNRRRSGLNRKWSMNTWTALRWRSTVDLNSFGSSLLLIDYNARVKCRFHLCTSSQKLRQMTLQDMIRVQGSRQAHQVTSLAYPLVWFEALKIRETFSVVLRIQ